MVDSKQQKYSRKHYIKNCEKILKRNAERVICINCKKTYSRAYISKHVCLGEN